MPSLMWRGAGSRRGRGLGFCRRQRRAFAFGLHIGDVVAVKKLAQFFGVQGFVIGLVALGVIGVERQPGVDANGASAFIDQGTSGIAVADLRRVNDGADPVRLLQLA